MKKNPEKFFFYCIRFKEILRIMKLINLLLIIGMLNSFAGGYSQDAVISVDIQNGTLPELFNTIEQNSEYKIFYKSSLINESQRISLQADQKPIAELLATAFAGKGLTYDLVDKVIIITSTGAVNQPIKVTGTITDAASNEPLIGVNVVIKGKATGVISDENGKFAIEVQEDDASLTFSYVGYVTQTVAVSGNSLIDIKLEANITSLEEIVVVGYGTQKKSDLTGSISSIKAKEITQMPTQRVDQALQGKSAGVMVLNTDGAPGGNATIRIRGMNSISGGNNALVVVDGLQGVNLNTLNPNDIESMEVLKDASATAIYGSRGANGVILVTTKKGVSGKPTLTYSMSTGVQSILMKQETMTAGEYAQAINDDRATKNSNGTPTPIFTPGQVAEFTEKGGTDWQNELFRNAPINNQNLSISGGTKGFSYFFSGGYVNQKGIFINTGFERFSLRTNLNMEINKWLSAGVVWSGVKSIRKGTEGNPNGALFNAPTVPVYDENGNYSKMPSNYGIPNLWNPVADAVESDINSENNQNFITANLDFKLIQGLTLRVSGMATLSNAKGTYYFNEYTYAGRPQGDEIGQASVDNSDYQMLQNTNILTYDKSFNNHHFVISAIAEQQVENGYGTNISASHFTTDLIGYNDLAGANKDYNSIANSSVYKRTLNSFLGRLNYTLMDKYMLTASYRADGSSVFGEDNKWGYFPSVSVAWRLSQESFIKDLDIFSDLKLRISYGITGNQGISPYQTQASISSGYPYPWMGGITTNMGYGFTNSGNTGLKWESTRQSNIGMDLGIFKGRLSATIDVYKKITDDLLMWKKLAYSSGFDGVTSNVGSIENKGLELAFSGDPLVGDFKWNTGFNISFNKNKALDIGDNDKIPFTTTGGGFGVNEGMLFLIKGQPYGQVYGWEYKGVWKESERADAALYGQLPGDPHYADNNQDTIIDSDDIKLIGNTIPKFYYGWTNRFSYKNFDLSIFIQGAQGYNIFNQSRIYFDAQGYGTSARLLDRYTTENQDTDVPAFIDQKTRNEANLTSKVFVDQRISRWLEDASYLRIKNLTLAYTLPKALASKISIANLRVYISGSNLVTLTRYSGYDPEASSFNSQDGGIGVDQGAYPSSKTYLFGIDITF
jgi:TonB-dependent starch-binding outer membrane protein SusC